MSHLEGLAASRVSFWRSLLETGTLLLLPAAHAVPIARLISCKRRSPSHVIPRRSVAMKGTRRSPGLDICVPLALFLTASVHAQ
jgi:hypothetical protein